MGGLRGRPASLVSSSGAGRNWPACAPSAGGKRENGFKPTTRQLLGFLFYLRDVDGSCFSNQQMVEAQVYGLIVLQVCGGQVGAFFMGIICQAVGFSIVFGGWYVTIVSSILFYLYLFLTMCHELFNHDWNFEPAASYYALDSTCHLIMWAVYLFYVMWLCHVHFFAAFVMTTWFNCTKRLMASRLEAFQTPAFILRLGAQVKYGLCVFFQRYIGTDYWLAVSEPFCRFRSPVGMRLQIVTNLFFTGNTLKSPEPSASTWRKTLSLSPGWFVTCFIVFLSNVVWVTKGDWVSKQDTTTYTNHFDKHLFMISTVWIHFSSKIWGWFLCPMFDHKRFHGCHLWVPPGRIPPRKRWSWSSRSGRKANSSCLGARSSPKIVKKKRWLLR